jgi:hypothetical protein
MITQTCLIAGSPYGLVFVVELLLPLLPLPLPLPLLVLLVLLLLAPVLAVLLEPLELAGVDCRAELAELPLEEGALATAVAVCATGGLGLGVRTTISGALASVARLAGPIAAATSAPNASIASTASAATRGVGNQPLDGRDATGAGSAGPLAAGTSLRPCSKMPAIRPATSAGRGPRRVPHSTQ